MQFKIKKTDWIRVIGIAVFLVAGILTYLYSQGYFSPNIPAGTNEIHFIDCGQGDSTLILSDGKAILIDASTAEGGGAVAAYLRRLGIQRIDQLWISHPHEDHMGGAEQILDEFQVESIYLKAPTEGTEPTARFYLDFLTKVQNQGKKIHAVKNSEEISCGSFVFDVLGPVEEYEDLNNQSIIMRGKCGKTSILFTGDQEISAEKDLLGTYGALLRSTILKVGHHGSDGSSSKAFLAAVDPDIGVISCGEGNRYGHPHQEALDRLADQGTAIYRTDKNGTVVLAIEEDGVHLKEAA